MGRVRGQTLGLGGVGRDQRMPATRNLLIATGRSHHDEFGTARCAFPAGAGLQLHLVLRMKYATILHLTDTSVKSMPCACCCGSLVAFQLAANSFRRASGKSAPPFATQCCVAPRRYLGMYPFSHQARQTRSPNIHSPGPEFTIAGVVGKREFTRGRFLLNHYHWEAAALVCSGGGRSR